MWGEVDLEKGIWNISAERMKMHTPHFVPLSTHEIEIFKQLKPITNHYPYIFLGRNVQTKPISKESISQGFDSTWIEIQLAHVDKSCIPDIYNHTLYLEKRRDLMNWYPTLMKEHIICLK